MLLPTRNPLISLLFLAFILCVGALDGKKEGNVTMRMISQKFTKQTLEGFLDGKPELWKSMKLSKPQLQHYQMLGGVAAPTKEHLDEIEQEHLRINSTFNKKQRQRTKGQHQYYNMPREFDVRRKWPQCARIINIIQDQSKCSSCWAVASASAMSDRACIASNGQRQVQISAADLMTCCTECQVTKGDGCQSGYTFGAWKYYTHTGIVSGGTYGSQSGCKPYPFPHGGWEAQRSDQCNRQCQNGQSYYSDRHFGSSVTYPRSMEEIQREVFHHGPVVVHLELHEDLMTYRSGIYYHRYGNKLGLHLVKILGWGEENGVPYWLAVNSWSETWGDRGFIKIVRGTNHLGIERLGVAGGYDFSRSASH